MDKKIPVILILILLAAASIATIVSVANIQALLEERIVATMTKKGLSIINPTISKIIDVYVCVITPTACVGNIITGKISEGAYKLIAGESAEAAKVIDTYNQVRSYEGLGTDIIEELKFNDKGQISEGALDVKEEIKIGNHIGELKEDDIKVKNTQVKFDKEAGITAIKFKGGGYVEAKGLRYENVQKGGEIKLDSKGKVIEADITASAEASYTFVVDDEKRTVDVPKGTNVRFDGKDIYITGKGFTFNDKYEFKINKDLVLITKSGEDYLFTGQDFIAPGGIHVRDACFKIPEVMKIGGKEITGMAINIAEGLACVGGKLAITEKGYLLEGGEAEYKKIKISVPKEHVLIADSDAEMANYKGNWVKITGKKIDMQSAAGGTIEEIRFLEGNEIVDIDEGGMLAMKITNGDGISVANNKEEGNIPLVEYHGPENGESMLKVGKFKFIWANKEPYVFLPEEQSEYESPAIQLESPWESVITTTLSNTFKVTMPDKKERVLFE